LRAGEIEEKADDEVHRYARGVSQVLDAAWDAYQDGGILRVSFHPNVSRNMTYAAFVSLLLMHDDETPARPGNHQRFTVYCELEHIALIIDDICRIQGAYMPVHVAPTTDCPVG